MARESKCKISGIYMITNTVNGKRYIGKSNDIYRRWKEHRCKYSWRTNHVIYRAFKKYGLDNFTFEIIHECHVNDLSEMEKHYIRQFDTFKNGYNETEGGEGMPGFKHSDETKKKLSEKLSGENNPNFGKSMSDEQRLLRSEIFKGKIYSQETLEKMSQAKTGVYVRGNHPKAIKVTCNNVVYDCIKDCADALGETYSRVNNWLKMKDNMPQKYIDLGLRYYGDSTTIYHPQESKNQPYRVICDGVIYDSAKDCSDCYGIKSGTLRSWINNKRPMPKEFKDLGLAKYYD